MNHPKKPEMSVGQYFVLILVGMLALYGAVDILILFLRASGVCE